MLCDELPKASHFLRRTEAGLIQLKLWDWEPVLARHRTVTNLLATMCFPFRIENIWFGKIQQAYIYAKYKAAGVWPPTW